MNAWLAGRMGVRVVLAGLLASAGAGRAMDWSDIQKTKRSCLESAAIHAMAQQHTGYGFQKQLDYLSTAKAVGEVRTYVNGPDAMTVMVDAAPGRGGRASEYVRIDLPRPVDMISHYSGLSMMVVTGADSSEEVRLGARLIGEAGEAVILPTIPVVSRWGDARHEVYFDWSFINYRDASEAVEVLKRVSAVEITAAAAARAPRRGASEAARSATFALSDVKLVNYLPGSFDPSRHRWAQEDRKPDLTLQHRCQEVTGLVARFGGDKGLAAAAASLDMAARTQCWDGSFLDGRRGARTVCSGEYTFGFTLYGLLCGYETIAEKAPHLLAEKVFLDGREMTRREACQRMFYRGAMARTAALPSQYRDDIIGGDTLMTGANRVLGYAIAMRMIADALDEKAAAAEVLAAYKPIMGQIADAQGKYSGGFPLLGEGDRHGGKGIHYDAGYTRTHMDWLVVGVRRTGDPLLVEMLKKYQTVFEAVMNERGTGLKRMISERHPGGGDVELILPHATAQVGMKYNLPVIAQWGYNVGRLKWGETPGNHFTYASHATGYGLGAHTSILYDDLASEPEPRDVGYRFPRQYPIWSSRLYTKDGKLVRTSKTTLRPDGSSENDFKIDVGEFPVTVGAPVRVRSAANVVAEAVRLSGWPTLLPADATVELTGDVVARGRVGEPIAVKLDGPTRIRISGPKVRLPDVAGGQEVPFVVELVLEGQRPGQEAELTVLRGAE